MLDVNDRLCEILGYSRDELLRKSARMLYCTDQDYEYVGREKYRQIQECGAWRRGDAFQAKGRQNHRRSTDSTPLNSADLSAGVTFTVLDITERMGRSEKGKAGSSALQAQKMEAIGALAGEHSP